MKQFLTVLSFEYNKVTKNTTYRVMTIIMLLLVIVGMSFPRILTLFKGDDSGVEPNTTKKIIYVIDDTRYANGIEYLSASLEDYDWKTAEDTEKADLTAVIDEGDAYGLLNLKADGSAQFTTKQVSMTDTFVPALQAILAQKHQTDLMTEYNLTAEQIQSIFTPPTFETIGRSAENSFAFTYILLILMFMSITMYGNMVTMSVITEKSSRTMELLVTSAKPRNLIFGKVIGTGLAGLTQLVLVIIAIFAMYQINIDYLKDLTFVSSLFEGSAGILIYTLVFYLLGFFLYAFLLGALGSMCSRVEDANSMIMPATLILLAGFYIAMGGALTNPDNIWIVIASMFPFFAPMVMLVRIGITDVPAWQITLSMLLTGVGVYGMGKLSVMIYRVGVLLYGNRPSFKEIFKALKQTKTM